MRMDGFADRYPRQLSGGQQQRVAIARALAVRPTILLLDEPFAALDKALRLDMQIELKRIQRNAGTTTILVTHDQEEALSLADRVALLNRGKLEQFASPTEIYDRPASLFVNTFVGISQCSRRRRRRARGRPVYRRAGGGRFDPRRPRQWRCTGDPGTGLPAPGGSGADASSRRSAGHGGGRAAAGRFTSCTNFAWQTAHR